MIMAEKKEDFAKNRSFRSLCKLITYQADQHSVSLHKSTGVQTCFVLTVILQTKNVAQIKSKNFK